MDLSVLPTFSALTVFVGCFRPLVRRAGRHTNVWFSGWGFLLVHYFALLLATGHENLWDRVRILVSIGALQLCVFCFIAAASKASLSRRSLTLLAELALPVCFQSVLYTFDIASRPGLLASILLVASFLLLALPAVHLLLAPQYRSRAGNHLALGFAALGAALALFSRIDPYIILNIILCALFLSAAYLTLVNAPRVTRGTGVAGVGLILWGISYLVQAAGWMESMVNLNHTLLDLPRLITAAGMIVSLVDDYVGRTERLALHDPLTGLPNRRLFENRLDQALEESLRTRTPVACLVIDVDNFKYINDNFGHPVGDGLLQALAKRLSWNLGPRDLLARTGGDEFTAVLVEATDEYHVRFIAGAMMAAGCVPVAIQDHLIDVRISIGVAVSPHDAGQSGELHKAADDAMYIAKRRGGSVVAFANEEVPQIHAV